MLSFEQALQQIREHARVLPTQELPLSAALGRVASQSLFSRETLPPFDNSAMDGFAVCAAEVRPDATFTVGGMTAAGDSPAIVQHQSGSAWRIMTGAAIPAPYDAVVPIERVQLNADKTRIRFVGEVKVGDHVRRCGEDYALGNEVIAAGKTLTSAHIMALAATGHGVVPVFAQPRISVFATGSELISDAGQALLPGQIRNSNAPYLCAALTAAGALVSDGGVLRDEPEHVRTVLLSALTQNPDVLITTGAVSAGDFDFIPALVRELGGEIIFHKVAIKPGKPLLFARFASGTLWFGIPGNPISTVIANRFFVRECLDAMHGLDSANKLLTVRSVDPVQKQTPLREFRKALVFIEQGQLQVRALKGQESHRIASLLEANAWIILTEDERDMPAGSPVQVCALLDECWPFAGHDD